jgi:hypothetical protein
VGQYRKLLEAGGDPVDVAGWLAEAKAERSQAERELADLASHRPNTADEVEALLAQVPDKLATLAGADLARRQRLYGELGLSLTYHPDKRAVMVEVQPRWGFRSCRRGDLSSQWIASASARIPTANATGARPSASEMVSDDANSTIMATSRGAARTWVGSRLVERSRSWVGIY